MLATLPGARSPSIAFLVVVAVGGAPSLTGCAGSTSTGVFEPEPTPEPDMTGITADDIGTLCVYDPTSGENPTNDCAEGLTCLIYTRDALYTPFTQGGGGVYASVWEDHTTIYRDDGLDEGYCTLVRSAGQPIPTCPLGTSVRQFNGGLVACMKNCSDNTQCREGYVCDYRYLDVDVFDGSGNVLGQCVRPCRLDVPDCVRSGWIPTVADPNQVAYMLAFEDLIGSSVCNEAIGRCEVNQTNGTVPPGGECDETEDCAGTVCLQGGFLGLAEGASGFCGGICQPNAQDPFATCNTPGYACQEGYKLGHQPFNTRVLGATEMAENTFGGWCLPSCMNDPTACNAIPGTACGQPDEDFFQADWNGVSMCLLPAVAAGI